MPMGQRKMFLKLLNVLPLLITTTISAKRKHGHHSGVAKYTIYPFPEYPPYYSSDYDYGLDLRDGSANLGCELEEVPFTNYQTCGMFYICHRLHASHDWVREDGTCPSGQSFDENVRGCVDIPCSALPPWPEVDKSMFTCTADNQIRQYPGNCHKYYICHWTGDYYTITHRNCNGHWFDEKIGQCREKLAGSKCPQKEEYLDPVPQGLCPKRRHYVQHPADCSMYLQCRKCGGEGDIYCGVVNKCSAGEIFSKNERNGGCVPGVCQYPVPPGWKCDGDGSLHVNPTDCTEYYKCVTCNDTKLGTDKCRENYIACPAGQYFDDVKKECITATTCPQDLKELPSEPGWHCEKDGETNAHPKDCAKYYTCIKCSKPSGWCYGETKCPEGMLFDDDDKKCVDSQVCPQNLTELPIDWNCDAVNEQNVVPDNCTDYYVCIPCNKPRGWCYTRHTCPEGHTFDDEKMECVRGRCPQWPQPIPDNWKCEKDSELNVDPTDCSKYYKCVPCPDQDKNPWCYLPESCPSGEWFDDRQKKCVKHIKCPKEDKELPDGDGWTCDSVGDTHVVPDDCRKFYQCYRCSMPKGWCYEDVFCPSGQTFDEILGECVIGKCPQDKKVVPGGPGWHCSLEGEVSVLPGNCSSYYVCEKCSKPGGWCYEAHDCPAGQTFDDTRKECVVGRCPQDPVPIPDNFNCVKDGDVHVHPDDCSRYYHCIWTGSYFTWTGYQCPSGQNFDEVAKTCVNGHCPQLLTEVGEGNEWQCNHEGEVNVFPGDCSKYFACIKCSKPRGWCYLHSESCPEGHNFDQTKKECVAGICPQDRPEILDGWTCSQEGREQVHPDDCRKYITCHRCNKPKGWCYEEHGCPSGQTFDNARLKCVPGRCPQLPPKLPPGWTCEKEGEKHVIPNDCSSFYTCITCDDGPWCYNGAESCPAGQTFDDTAKQCVHGRCRQYPEILPPSWACGLEGEFNVNPSDCSAYFKCLVCPDMDGWCYTPHTCPDGQNFDQRNKKCVAGICPQHPLPLPTGWKCKLDGELNVDPTDCSRYYKCLATCPDADWCYEPFMCLSGSTFDNKKKKCVEGSCPQNRPELPIDWVCEFEEDSHVIPTDCSSFYICYPCTKGRHWCYEKQKCPHGYTYDDNSKTCVEGACPQDEYKPPCTHVGQILPHPYKCEMYFRCITCTQADWCVEIFTCPGGQNFYLPNKKCVTGPCGSAPAPVAPTSPTSPAKPTKQCRSYSDAGKTWPDPSNCKCYYSCSYFLWFMKVKHHCCWWGKSYVLTESGQYHCRWAPCTNRRSLTYFDDDDYY